ncbi:GNAT family N-acetyltransferase [Leucobacter albus]|uniref:GNAT family N-acetyltransferase n=1 Tax=Leucobacter albus TaxID=272210 RepID=A0ABW3TSN1_9MICO
MPNLPENYTLHSALGLDSLNARTFHEIAKLRQEVFVLEQDCVYLDLDGRDTESTTEQFWVAAPLPAQAAPPQAGESGGAAPSSSQPVVAATLRVLDESAREPGLHAIGRVVTSANHRGKALAAALMEAAVARYGSGPLVLEAQSHLTGWYERFGFVVDGDEFVEDGIPHTPMRRPLAARS